MDVAKFKALYVDNERNFRGVDLSGADLSNLELDRIDFRGANLQRANFQGSTLQRADFRGSELKGTIFKEANLQYANFTGMNLKYANFSYANFRHAKLKNIIRDSEQALFLQTEAEKPNESSYFDEELTNFEYANLQFANLNNTFILNANLRGTNLLITFLTAKKNEETISTKEKQEKRKFRKQLLKQYGYRCLITGCGTVQLLEAAHIEPYSQNQNNDPSNGLLLRTDIHTLFDRNLIAIDKDTKVHVHSELRNTDYWRYDNTILKLNPTEFNILNKRALENRYNAIRYWSGYLYFQLTIEDACDSLYE